MKELQEILKKISQFNKSERAILATVVALEGSGYRRPGARMLIDENGYSIGTVSGGCLEADVLERAKKVLQTGKSEVITYDTTKDENSVFGLGMGCRGIVRILLECVTKENPFFSRISEHLNNRKSFISATLIKSSTNSASKIGSRIIFDETETLSSDFDEENSRKLIDSLKEIADDRKTFSIENNLGEFFIEKHQPPLSLLLFGAGFDAIPLANYAKSFGWTVTIIDHRAGWANSKRFSDADEIIVSRSENLSEQIFQDENSAAVLMTHNYDRDREILPLLLKSAAFYVGALGPKRRATKMLEEIGETFSETQLSRLHAPIGLDIGAETPEEIALSIIAEIKSVLSQRKGGFLRERQGSIYDRK